MTEMKFYLIFELYENQYPSFVPILLSFLEKKSVDLKNKGLFRF